MFSLFNWIYSLFRLAPDDSGTMAASRRHSSPSDDSIQTTTAKPDAGETIAILPKDGVTFLQALINTETPPKDLQSFSSNDRTFVSNCIRKIRENSFEIPMLPNAVIRTQELLSNPKVVASDFIDIIKEDPTLSVELLRLANSSYLGFSTPTLDLKHAIVRVGFGQLHGLVTMLSLRSRILQGEHFRNEVKWIMELSLTTAKLCQQLAPELHMAPGEAFTLGLLHHIEYLIVLGEASQNSGKNFSGAVSRDAVLEVVHRFGDSLHALTSRSWGFGEKNGMELLGNGENEQKTGDGDTIELRKRIDTLQRMLITALGGKHHLTDTAGFNPTKVKEAISVSIAQTAN